MDDASVEYAEPTERNWVGRAWLSAVSGEVLVLANDPETGVGNLTTILGSDLRAPRIRVHTGYSRLLSQMMEWVWNLGTLFRLPTICRMVKTADDRRTKGRSLRSSLSVGKPHTYISNGWRREAVDSVLQQEIGLCLAW